MKLLVIIILLPVILPMFFFYRLMGWPAPWWPSADL